MWITFILILTCIVTPIRIAFYEEDTLEWEVINYTVDFFFLFDIIVCFNSAYYDEDFRIVEDRWVISIEYLRGWFLIDILSIFPFQIIAKSYEGGDTQAANSNELARIAKLGRIYKLVKLTRLIRVIKIIKDKSKFLRYAQDILQLGQGFERLFFFVITTFLIIHILTCLWIFFALFNNYEGTWMENEDGSG